MMLCVKNSPSDHPLPKNKYNNPKSDFMRRKAKLYAQAVKSLPFFMKYIFYPFLPKSYVEPTHIYKWGEILQNFKKTMYMAPRGHLKSYSIYAYIMWRIFRARKYSERWLYISFKETLVSEYHIPNIKKLIEENPHFNDIIDNTPAKGVIEYSWDDIHTFEMRPAGILTFKRGWHGEGIICDDILLDPSDMMNLTMINKVKTLFFDDLVYLPNPDGYIHVVGTPQHPEDLFFTIREQNNLLEPQHRFSWHKFSAIVSDIKKEVLWPERYTYEQLDAERRTRPKSFSKERMCEPVWSSESFFSKDYLIRKTMNPASVGDLSIENGYYYVAGHDIGKKGHPAHLAVFRVDTKGNFYQIHQKFFDGVGYWKQAEYINSLTKSGYIDAIAYDNTRGEFEGFEEQGNLVGHWIPLSLVTKNKYMISSLFEKTVAEDRMTLLPDDRQLNQICQVTNDLDAIETPEGHGDSFWSISLALYAFTKLSKNSMPTQAMVNEPLSSMDKRINKAIRQRRQKSEY